MTEKTEPEIECDGWVAYGPDGKPCEINRISESEAWFHLCEGFEMLEEIDPGSRNNQILGLKGAGYTVRPVCFVSPSDYKYLTERKRVHLEALFARMREETEETIAEK